MLENKLRRIFNWYNEIYSLNCKLTFVPEGTGGVFHTETNDININLKHPAVEQHRHDKEIILCSAEIETKSIQKFFIHCLLHELKHAIDYKYNKKQFDEEFAQTDVYRMNNDTVYHDSLPFEKRATWFAKENFKDALKISINQKRNWILEYQKSG